MKDEFDENPTLAQIAVDGLPIAGWQFMEVAHDIRLYWLQQEADCGGFKFCAVNYIGGPVDNRPSGFDHPEARFWIVARGQAYFDGVRHLYFSDDDDPGYLYYPDLDGIAKTMRALRTLEEKLCQPAALTPAPPTETDRVGRLLAEALDWYVDTANRPTAAGLAALDAARKLGWLK